MGKYIVADPSKVKNPKRIAKKPPQNETKSTENETEKLLKPGIKRKLSTHEPKTSKKRKITQPETNKKHVVVIKNSTSSDFQLQLENDSECDLFHADEVKNSYENVVNKDLYFNIIDEVSLEGLDGITLEALWKRLERTYPLFLTNHIKELLWRLLCNNNRIQFYLLKQERGNLEIRDHFRNVDPEKGDIIETDGETEEIYPFTIVPDKNVLGSCSTYHSRKESTVSIRKLTEKRARKTYGTKLVIVADLKCRLRSIFNEFSDPNVELLQIEYCVLERLGRSREMGDITHSTLATYLKLDTKSVYHYKKHMGRNQLISKQKIFIQEKGAEVGRHAILLQLPRFYNLIKSKRLIITEQVVKLLKTRWNLRLEYAELKQLLPKVGPVVMTKTLKSSEVRRYLNTDILCAYRDMYPEASEAEWKCKSNAREKCIRIIELKDPTVNVIATWNDKEDSDDEDVEEVNESTMGRVSFNVDFLTDIYMYALSKGVEGVTQIEVQRYFDVDLYSARAAIRKLLGRNVFSCKRVDEGKQRIFRFFPRCLSGNEPVVKPTASVVKRNSNTVLKLLENQRNAVSKKSVESKKDEEVVEITGLEHFLTPIEFVIFEYSDFLKEIQVRNSELSAEVIKAVFNIKQQSFPLRITLYTFVKLKENFDLNSLLVDLKPLHLKNMWNSFKSIYSCDFQDDKSTKCLLIRAMFGEIVIKDSIQLENVSNSSKAVKRKHVKKELNNTAEVAPEPLNSKPLSKPTTYLGINPQIVHREIEDHVRTEVLVSTPPEEFKYNAHSYTVTNREMTERVILRINIVISVLNEQKIMEAPKMLGVIEKKEQEGGYNKKIDRKSLLRIFNTMTREGYIKFYKVIVTNGVIERSQILLCHPSIDHTHLTVTTAIQQLKLRHFISTSREHKVIVKTESPSPYAAMDVNQSIAEMRQMTTETDTALVYDKNAGKTYGFRPKFQRMRILHEFLLYLVYLLPQNTRKLSEDEVKSLFEDYKISLSEEDLREMPPIYAREISWKMFIPPLPVHKGWKTGWTLICDFLLRLPLSVFVKIHNVTYAVPELKEYLSHPVKRYYLIKKVPQSVRTALLHKQRYFTQLQETCNRLAYIGLLQFGPERYKERNQMFIYLNQTATLLDTSSSEPAYHKTSLKDYSSLEFVFNTSTDVENYWYNLYTISMNTRLNARNVMVGQTIIITDVSANASLVEAIKSRSAEEARELDNGTIPGDGRGACGLDSSLWVHITRNWLWGTNPKRGLQTNFGLKNEKLDKIITESVPYQEISRIQLEPRKSKVYLHSGKPMGPKLGKFTLQPSKTSKKNQKIYRQILGRKTTIKKREYADHVDKQLQKKLNKLKVPWEEIEDKILLMSKAVLMFLCPKSTKRHIVPYTAIRDVLHRLNSNSWNKSSRAVMRRLLTLNSSDSTMKSIQNNYMQLFKINEIRKYFSELIYQINREDDSRLKLSDAEYTIAFIYMMSFVYRHMEEVQMLLLGKVPNLDYISMKSMQELDFVEPESSLVRYVEAESETDVRKDVIKSIIHSSLENNSKNTRWAFQLFRVYQNFPDTLIREVVNEMKNQQIISMKKMTSEKGKKRGHTPFYLSNSYMFSLATTFTELTAINAYNTSETLLENEGKLELDLSFETVDRRKYGQLLGLNEICTLWSNNSFKFDIPDAALVLNPNMEDHSELITELAVRWQSRLTKELKSVTEVERPATKCTEIEMKEEESPKENETALDLTIDGGTETIDKLKSWVTDCMALDRERRSPSPEFLNFEEVGKEVEESATNEEVNEGEEDKLENSVPTLEEIKEGMLKPESNPNIPYVTDLYDILSKDTYNESTHDPLHERDERLDSLKKHFITIFPQATAFVIENFENFKLCSDLKFVHNSGRIGALYEKILNSNFIRYPEGDLSAKLSDLGGDSSDCTAATTILDFIHSKGVCGATTADLKKHFARRASKLDLHAIVKALIEHGSVLLVGICSVSLVHSEFQTHWLIKTFSLSQEEENMLNRTSVDEYNEAKSTIEERLSGAQSLYVKIHPWNRVDGSLNETLLFKWLCIILSHCLDVPKIPLTNLFNKFSFIKPVDVFYLLEILRELNCVDLYVYETSDHLLTTEWSAANERPATFLDNFDEIFADPTNIAMTSIGAFFHNTKRNT